ncbi:hypothetical protein [Vibrio vulnificus YJ016]|uniref:Uncharacterized protein n=1 Tax=Vibrio vulnificus (strain YJ016) TaxID=196600 RepID=Q7MI22_VIBVY|nr:hypothetical protein [Vibrio vulnificus YJ016]
MGAEAHYSTIKIVSKANHFNLVIEISNPLKQAEDIFIHRE